MNDRDASQLTTGQLLDSLGNLRGSKENRLRGAWDLLTRAYPEQRDVALDFVVEHEVLASSQVAKLCGEPQGDGAEAVWKNPVDGSEMIWIRPGTFFIGSKRQPAHCSGFYLAAHPVTNQQFEQFIAETDYAPASDPDASITAAYLSHWSKKGTPLKKQLDHPVTWVSMVDALHYCVWAGVDLPTEWLWEKAARGPEGDRFPWGDTTPRPNLKLANLFGKATRPIGSYPEVRSQYGCQDMVGNVSEWCYPGLRPGLFFPSHRAPQVLGKLTEGERPQACVRGSCYLREDPQRMVAWHRRSLLANRRNKWVGFRVAFYPWQTMNPTAND